MNGYLEANGEVFPAWFDFADRGQKNFWSKDAPTGTVRTNYDKGRGTLFHGMGSVMETSYAILNRIRGHRQRKIKRPSGKIILTGWNCTVIADNGGTGTDSNGNVVRGAGKTPWPVHTFAANPWSPPRGPRHARPARQFLRAVSAGTAHQFACGGFALRRVRKRLSHFRHECRRQPPCAAAELRMRAGSDNAFQPLDRVVSAAYG